MKKMINKEPNHEKNGCFNSTDFYLLSIKLV